MLHSRRKSQRGATLLFLTLSMTGLCAVSALALDEGYMWYARNKAQKVADSAALAWALQNSATARDRVISAYQNHGAKFILNSSKTNATPTTFTVYGTILSPSVFGQVVGRGATNVPAHATATALPAGRVYSSAPWGPIADQPNPDPALDPALRSDLIFLNSLLTQPPANFTYQTRQITLKATTMSGSTISAMGNFGALDLVGASGGNDYRANVGYNSSEMISIGDQISTLTGNKVGPTQQGMGDRLNPTLSPPNGMDSTYVTSSSPYNDWFYGRSNYPVDYTDASGKVYYKDPYRQDVNDDHLVVLPLISTPGKNGSATVTVLGFGVFFIENTSPSGNSQNVVTGRFVGMNIAGAAGGNTSVVGGTGYASGGGATVVSLAD
jgi:hypothetical protein